MSKISPFLIFLVWCFTTQAELAQKELHWDWNTIDVESISFPSNFEFCAATAEYQLSGSECFYTGSKMNDCPDSNWARYEKKENSLGKSTYRTFWKGN